VQAREGHRAINSYKLNIPTRIPCQAKISSESDIRRVLALDLESLIKPGSDLPVRTQLAQSQDSGAMDCYRSLGPAQYCGDLSVSHLQIIFLDEIVFGRGIALDGPFSPSEYPIAVVSDGDERSIQYASHFPIGAFPIVIKNEFVLGLGEISSGNLFAA